MRGFEIGLQGALEEVSRDDLTATMAEVEKRVRILLNL